MDQGNRAWLLLGCMALAACGGAAVEASGPRPAVYPAFADAAPVEMTGHDDNAMEPFIAPGGAVLLFNNSNAPDVNTDLFWAQRQADGSFAARGRIGGVNSALLDGVPSMDAGGGLYFVSVRDYAATLASVFVAQFTAGHATPPQVVAGLSQGRPGLLNFDAEISRDGETLWFVDGRFTGAAMPASASIAVAQRQGTGFVRRADSAAMLASVNRGGLNYAPAISADGRELFFTRVADRRHPRPVIMRAARADTAATFGPAQVVGGITGHVEAPSLADDGRTLYYHKLVDGRFAIWRVTRPAP